MGAAALLLSAPPTSCRSRPRPLRLGNAAATGFELTSVNRLIEERGTSAAPAPQAHLNQGLTQFAFTLDEFGAAALCEVSGGGTPGTSPLSTALKRPGRRTGDDAVTELPRGRPNCGYAPSRGGAGIASTSRGGEALLARSGPAGGNMTAAERGAWTNRGPETDLGEPAATGCGEPGGGSRGVRRGDSRGESGGGGAGKSCPKPPKKKGRGGAEGALAGIAAFAAGACADIVLPIPGIGDRGGPM